MNAVITEIPALAHDAGVPPAPPEAHQQAGEERLIPLKRLVASPFNVRRRKRTGIAALANNIAAVGLLQNLVVHPMKVGAKRAQTFGVAAGETRRLALLELVERGLTAPDAEVRCLVVSAEAAVLISTSENEMREPMHPADQCEAYRVLVDAGRTIAEIALTYGTSETLVRQRLKLARVSPKLVDLFREDQIRLDQMQALALSDSHAEQERVWFEAKPHDRDAHTIRRKLVAGERDFRSNRVARFVGMDAYEAAGGFVRRDLFSHDGAAWYTDQALMERVAAEQLADIAAKVQADGWDWVEVVPVFDYTAQASFLRVVPTVVEPSAEQRQEMEAIQARLDAIEAEQQADDTDDDAYERLEEEATALAVRHAAIEDSLAVYTPLQMAGAGAIVTIDHDGTLEILRGWTRRGDPASRGEGESTGGDDMEDSSAPQRPHTGSGAPASPDAPDTKGPHSRALTLRLNARRTASAGMALARNPHIALAALVHRFLITDYAPGSGGSAIDIQLHNHTGEIERNAPELADDLPYRLANEQRAAWAGTVPHDTDALLAWCVDQTDERLMLILAQYVGASVDSITGDEDAHSVNALISALNLDLADDWKATRASYFDHVPKARIAEVVTAAVSPTEGMRLLKLKKAEAAAEAERLVSATRWLPEHFALAETRPKTLWRLAGASPDRDDDGDQDQGGARSEVTDEHPHADQDTTYDAAAVAEGEGMPSRD
ncbi:parB-like nuclease domain protein [Burkholderia gladioli]|uniref:ParB-like nuclease domain protein n=1 Tax=Burkholderia gladioli TaxID=28095 RepID=A0AAW3ENZ5_BURGA|nr:ParB/RepB/Spo0J family partition protein [Burkholderia gladioli]KGC09217.1 parB-like nuclease domain protein [Burkholderia gladioli]